MNESECRRMLAEPFDVDIIEEKGGLLYVPHEHVRDRLIWATDNTFDWEIKQILFRETSGEVRRFSRETNEAVYPQVMIVVGRLTIPGLGGRDGIGAHPIDAGAGEDAAFKSAESDAIKRAAMAFGVGLRQLYIDSDKKRSRGGSRPSYEDVDQTTGEIRESRQIKTPGAPATEKQIFLIGKLIDEKTQFSKSQFDLEGLTKQGASDAIEALNKGTLPSSWTTPDPKA